MKIVRIIEVWEKGLDGALVGELPVADTISTTFLLGLFAKEQKKPDPYMQLSYILNADHFAALQPYVADQFDPTRYDYILSAHGEPDY
ncbi:DUF7683 domain-containing protein [Jeongeupia chitinilytica]|uniref:DUF7683 domain-containing protein n=1 Tax=Jeongeupia chitinilytica TaxID=1041641 RepID=A0ABQ3H338_9NEIS|nr:hypothetical protein [Jeongeupia chitinilytica]GHD67951.1 hypothetical protein GCM10007350_32400 [Jeongeupia chitinilytica]